MSVVGANAVGYQGTMTPTLRSREEAKSVDRLMVLDAGRVVAGLGVVWFHSIESDSLRDSGAIGRFSVAFYTMMAMVFLFEHIERNPERHFAEFAWGKIKRLYVPFLAWSAISLPLLAGAKLLEPRLELPGLGWDFLVAGATLPLWFVPFVIVVTLLAFPLAKWVVKDRRRELAVLLACVAAALGLEYFPWGDSPLRGMPMAGRFMELSWNRWSAAYWGVALAIVYRRWLREWPWRSVIGIVGAVGTVVGVAMMWHGGMTAGLKAHCGICFALLALAPWRGEWIEKIGRYGRLAFGLYFAHMTMIILLRCVANRAGIAVGWERDVGIFLATVGICGAVLVGMVRTKMLRWMVA